MANKFKKNDQILVIAGSDKGKKSKIISIKKDRVLIEGVNIATIHKKPTSNAPGEIVKMEKPIHISNISHIEDNKAVKINFKTDDGKEKIFTRKARFSRKTNKKIS